MQPRTQSRALQLAVMDMDVQGKRTDEEIGDDWGITARTVRGIRQSDEYILIVGELRRASLSYVADRVGQMQADALEHLEGLVPKLARRASDILRRPHNADDDWIPNSKSILAANAVVSTLYKLSSIGSVSEALEDNKRPITPNLVIAKSETKQVMEYRRGGSVIDAEYEDVTPTGE